ncbi:hypothetical protein L3X38_044925 [Prunus dulcis]|uniref:DNA topoisomerase (ATP-hydrolyzing) n=1 Tax=Prunus dulcis TaxID=3755 RepID=A0AAD4UZK1_PRUDU|nr:hypothetical protein L3X38_044925 [Prunus dulcis]
MPKRDKSVSVPCKSINKGVSVSKKLRLAIESALQINHPRDESTQLEVQRKIDFELIKKNIEEHRWNFDPLPSLSIQEKEEIVEVSDLPGEDVQRDLEKLINDTTQSWNEKEDFGFTVPSRDSSYTHYVHHVLRTVLTKHDIKRSLSGRSPKLCLYTLCVISSIHNRCFDKKVMYVKKRGIYYDNVVLFNCNRKVVYGIIDDICCMLRCTSLSLRVVSDTTGTIIGPFTFVCGDTPHKCSSSAEKIPSCELIADTRRIFMRMLIKCIMVSGQGYGDRSTKVFLKKLHRELRIPILAIVDCNPYGLQILFDYKYGSANSAFDSVNLAIGDIRWLGVRPSDLEKYKIDVEDNKFKDRAVSMAKGFLEQDFVKMDDNWVSEIEKMLEIRNSANIERLHTKGIDFLSMKFLAEKLESKDWI